MSEARLEVLVRQLQGVFGGARFAAGRVLGGGGSTYTLSADTGVASITGVATGQCRIIMDGSAVGTTSIWPVAIVEDNSLFTCTFSINSASPATVDIFQWTAAGAAANRSFAFHVFYLPS